ncbi:MAG: NYN domain-containing protein [Rhizobacter sp.]|nr:NYN domain-containing protein [Rhizobacter sp.]
MRTFVYVDGFNLYYRALKPTKRNPRPNRKWLDLHKFVQSAMPADTLIERINYYTADISTIPDPDAPKRQQAYFKALETIPCLEIHKGQFLVSKPMMYLDESLTFSPRAKVPQDPPPRFAKVVKTEEKGTDVNLGVHLVRDAFVGAFEQAVVISNDTDLAEAIRIVTAEVNLPVYLIAGASRQSATLTKHATGIKYAERHIRRCQFPDTLTTNQGETVTKPDGW